jgi:hypothetical protein
LTNGAELAKAGAFAKIHTLFCLPSPSFRPHLLGIFFVPTGVLVLFLGIRKVTFDVAQARKPVLEVLH